MFDYIFFYLHIQCKSSLLFTHYDFFRSSTTAMVNSVGGSSNSFNSSNIVVGEDCGGGGDDVVDRPAVTRFTHRNNEHERSDSPSSADTTPTLLCESGFAAARTTADGGVAVLRRYSIDKQKDAMTATTAATTNATDSEKTSGVYCSLPLEKVQ